MDLYTNQYTVWSDILEECCIGEDQDDNNGHFNTRRHVGVHQNIDRDKASQN